MDHGESTHRVAGLWLRIVHLDLFIYLFIYIVCLVCFVATRRWRQNMSRSSSTRRLQRYLRSKYKGVLAQEGRLGPSHDDDHDRDEPVAGKDTLDRLLSCMLADDVGLREHWCWHVLELLYEFDAPGALSDGALLQDLFDRLSVLHSPQRGAIEGRREGLVPPGAPLEDELEQRRPFLPKYNTFVREDNADRHLEPYDEQFDEMHLTNQLRSRGLAAQFHLQMSDLRDLLSGTSSDVLRVLWRFLWSDDDVSTQAAAQAETLDRLRNELALYNYVHMDRWKYEQLLDMLNQLWGGKEQIVLTREACIREIEYQLHRRGQKTIYPDIQERGESESERAVPDDEFKLRYFALLRAIDMAICCPDSIRPNVYRLHTSHMRHPLSFEWIGHLCQHYLLPWEAVSLPDVSDLSAYLSRVIWPWRLLKAVQHPSYEVHIDVARLLKQHSAQAQKVIVSHYNMYRDTEYRYAGMLQLEQSRPFIESGMLIHLHMRHSFFFFYITISVSNPS